MRTYRKPYALGLLAGTLLVCSCATNPSGTGVVPQVERPAAVTFNRDAGRGYHLYITLRLESGEELPFLVDTGAPTTIFGKSWEPKLGKCLGTATLDNFGTPYEGRVYTAPTLYLGKTPLITDSNVLASDLVEKMRPHQGHPVAGILGMDCLRHYCIQLDFQAARMRFLNPERLNPAHLGQAFPITFAPGSQDGPEPVRPTIHCRGLIGEEDTDLLIDTGADCDSLLEPPLFRRAVQEQRARIPPDSPPAPEPNDVGLPLCV